MRRRNETKDETVPKERNNRKGRKGEQWKEQRAPKTKKKRKTTKRNQEKNLPSFNSGVGRQLC